MSNEALYYSFFRVILSKLIAMSITSGRGKILCSPGLHSQDSAPAQPWESEGVNPWHARLNDLLSLCS